MMVEEFTRIVSDALLAANSLETGSVRLCGGLDQFKSLHVHRGIEILAREVGALIETKKRVDSTYPYEHWFEFGGVRFYQISASGRLEEDEGGNT